MGKAGWRSSFGPGERASETLRGVEKLWGGPESASLPRWRPVGPAVGLPRGIKIPSAAELFNSCLSAVTALAGPWRALETQAALLAAWEAGDRGALSLQGESPPLACCRASEPGWAGARSLSLIPSLLPRGLVPWMGQQEPSSEGGSRPRPGPGSQLPPSVCLSLQIPVLPPGSPGRGW